jgi:NDP-sugar pyrophosphorylase family protein
VERSYLPSHKERGETFVGHVYEGYWIDIGTPEKYVQVHRDIMDGRFAAGPFRNGPADRKWISSEARIEDGATVDAPCFIDEGVVLKSGARVAPYSVIGRQTQIEEHATVDGAVVWANCRIGEHATVGSTIVGRNCHIGRHATLSTGAVLGDKTTLTDYSKA